MPYKDPKKHAAYQKEYTVRRKKAKAIYDHARVADKRERKAAYDKEYCKINRVAKNAYAREWFKQHREQARNSRLLRTFKISAVEWDAKLAAQNFRCAVCKVAIPAGRGTWHTDHDHSCCSGVKSCGKCVRGLLCRPCNSALGHFKDSPDVLRAAANYIEEWRSRNDSRETVQRIL